MSLSLSPLAGFLPIPSSREANAPELAAKEVMGAILPGIVSEPATLQEEKTKKLADVVSERYLRRVLETSDDVPVHFSLSKIRESEAACRSAEALDTLDKVKAYLRDESLDLSFVKAYHEAAPLLGQDLCHAFKSLEQVREFFANVALFEAITEKTSQEAFLDLTSQFSQLQRALEPLEQAQQEIQQVIQAIDKQITQ